MNKLLKKMLTEGYENPLAELRDGQFLHARKRDWVILSALVLSFPILLVVSKINSNFVYFSFFVIDIALLGIFIYILKEISRRAVYVTAFLLALALTTIHLFAIIYSLFGLCSNECLGQSPRIVYDTYYSTYFSIVSWTTLGYGDFQPVGWMRLVAATEALVGYIYMGVVVGFSAQLTFEIFKSSHDTKKNMDFLSTEIGYSGEPDDRS